MSLIEDRHVLLRKYYQVYADLNVNVRRPDILAAIVNSLAPMQKIEIQGHQTRIILEGDVEVKIGYDPFIQVSCPDHEKTIQTFNKILTAIKNAIEKSL